ncbi:MAG: protocatechuate 3,4-dioxygenase subunit alpha [Chloroflexota bacterium]
MSPSPTASNTVGPFFHLGLDALAETILADPGLPGERITVLGRVLDGDGLPVSDAMIETWQADWRGIYPHPEDRRAGSCSPGFTGFGRIPTGDDGSFAFTTIKPGPVPGPGDSLQAPHIVVLIFMRGLLKHLVTRMYFADDPRNEADPILALVPPDRRGTLIARPLSGNIQLLHWNIIVQGPEETVFFEY